MADTPTIQPPADYTPLSPDQKSQWNGFASYLGKQNVGPELDANPDLGHAFMQQYANKNRDFSLTADQIPHVQYEHQALRAGDSPIASLGNDSYYARKTSPVNGQINSLTANSFYPTVATRDAKGKVVTDYGTDVDKFTAANPGVIAGGGGKKAPATATPAPGAKAAPAAVDPWAGKNAIPIGRKDATGTTIRPATVANFRGPGGTQKEAGPSSLGGQDQAVDPSQQQQTPDTPLKQLGAAYNKAGQDYTSSLYEHEKQDYSQSPQVKLTGGKDPGISVPADMIKDVAMAAKRQGYDPYKLLGQLSLESSFGQDTDTGTHGVKSDSRLAQFQSINLDEKYRPLSAEQYLENNGVPGVKAVPDKRQGYVYQVQDEGKVNDYLTKHPEVMKAYQAHLAKHSQVPDTFNTYDEAAKRDKTGLQHFNADPAYGKQVSKYAASLMNDPEVKKIVEALK